MCWNVLIKVPCYKADMPSCAGTKDLEEAEMQYEQLAGETMNDFDDGF